MAAPQALVARADALLALAAMGDLSMGQPLDHSPRTAWLAVQLARAVGADPSVQQAVAHTALLRWSGCTANAVEFDRLLGDDVQGRAVMLSQAPADPRYGEVIARVAAQSESLTRIHCEVSGDVSRMLAMPAVVEEALRHIFLHMGPGWGGAGAGDGVRQVVALVNLASELEVLVRVHGLPGACAIIGAKAGPVYPALLALAAVQGAAPWFAQLDGGQAAASLPLPEVAAAPVALSLVANVIDLKMPWMTGSSEAVALAALRCAAATGLDADAQARCLRAGLLVNLGRCAVANGVWHAPGALTTAQWEQVRLAPYWASRAATRLGGLRGDVQLASQVFERGDGSGYFRGSLLFDLPREAQVLAAATMWAALGSARPWRAALAPADAAALMQAAAREGRLAPRDVDALCGVAQTRPLRMASGAPADQIAGAVTPLTPREAGVLAAISRGCTNKQAARELGISPSTVRTHMENSLRKLACSTRAAATLKARTLGWI